MLGFRGYNCRTGRNRCGMPRLGGSVARGVQYGKCKSDWRFALRLTNPARSRVGLDIFGSDPKDHKTKIGVGPGLACTPSEREL